MCASPVVESRVCARCGAGADDEARFCARCGVDLGPPPPVAPPPCPPPVVAARPVPLLPAEPSAIGRRASPLGWLVVTGGAALFLAASVGVIALAGRGGIPDPGPGASPAVPGVPLARFDELLHHPATVSAGEPFEIEVEAVNASDAATDRVWLVVEWHPDDLPASASAGGSFVACDPAGCSSREDRAAGRTVVSWTGLAPGTRRVLRLTVAADGLVPGTTFWYRVRGASGVSETALDGGYVWDLDLEVER
jgi:hypothetical protein